MILNTFSEVSTVKARIPVEVREGVINVASVERLEHVVEVLAQVVSIVMIAADALRNGHNVVIIVAQVQIVGRFGAFALLVLHFFAPFFATVWVPSICKLSKPR